jgi:hypothetical protein
MSNFDGQNDITVYVNSFIDRTSFDFNTSQWTSYLSTPIRCKPNQVLKMSIESISIPNTVYPFDSTNNLLWFEWQNQNNLRYIQLPTNRIFVDGADLASSINTLFQSAGYSPVTCSYNAQSQCLRITNNSGNHFRIVSSYRFNNDSKYGMVYSQAVDRIGFTNFQNPIVNTTYEARSIPRLLRTTCFYLCADILSASNFQSYVPSPYRVGQ